MTTGPDGLRVLGLLDRLHSRYGPQVFGQVMQRLLAAAFASSGHVVTPNAVGVPDFTATKATPPRGFGVEVKTTADGAVVLSDRDLAGVMNCGHTPVVALLDYPSDNPTWHFLDAASLKPGVYEPFRLKRKPKALLDFDANESFSSLLVEHHAAAMDSTAALEHSLAPSVRRVG